MNKLILISILFSSICFGQIGTLVENKVLKFSLKQKSDTIDFVLVDTLLDAKKPVFLWCQGSLPMPLFCEIENYGNYFFGGGVVNFNYKEIAKDYHLVIISMPKTPLIGKKEHLNNGFQYIPNPQLPNEFSKEFINADFLQNYVERASAVLSFLKKQKWVDNKRLVVAGHSQGSKVATKIASKNKSVTHLGLFSANPFGRIDQFIREARMDAQLGKSSWEKADSIINDNYEYYKFVNDQDSIKTNPSLKAWKTFSETFYDDWLNLNIPIYLAYGTEDRVSDLCDIVPLFFIEKEKNNLTLKRYLKLEHNFFEVGADGRVDHEKGHWIKVMSDFMKWIE
jgi:pimeloyl-ACP methyl ester carboxylesterase